MKIQLAYIILFTLSLFSMNKLKANIIFANSSNYTTYLSTLTSGDTLQLASGSYINNLKLNGLNGTMTQAIVIIGSGNTTIFLGQSCCNTISITQCSYLIIKNLKLDGLHQQVDAVKAEGTTGNWVHHITLEYLNIVNYDGDQQNVGISTKCPAWDWVIRKNKIENVGTGMYLGNSPGDKPFVNGIIEYNYIANTIGYNIEIKHQLDGVRDEFPGIAVNGKTILRHNVFTKNETSSTGGNARPNLLVGGFPTTGWGSTDYYEIYGNFFYNNPVEALFQGTGNIMLYENIFVNHFDPSGFRAVYLTPQNGISPQDVKIYHNTIWVANSSGGLRLYNPNANFKQYCYANVVFAPLPITNFTDSLNNITDSYSNTGKYVLSANSNIAMLNLYPKAGQLTGTLTPNPFFKNNSSWDKDFNDDPFDWTYRGAYSGCCLNKGWQLQLDTISETNIPTSLTYASMKSDFEIFPNPVSGFLFINLKEIQSSSITIYNLSGKIIFSQELLSNHFSFDFSDKPNGVYFMLFKKRDRMVSKKIMKI